MKLTHSFKFRVRLLALALLMATVFVPAAWAVPARPSGTNYVPRPASGARVVTPAATAADLLQCLLGPNVSVSNAVLTAAPAAAGTFSGALNVIGFDQGIILSSGNIATLTGPNLSDATSTDNAGPGDPDLEALVPGYTTYDAAILEFDFSCTTAQNVVFQYVFGSEEYNEWVNTAYNDVFGFFLNGVNIAIAPAGCSNAGSPVSINNVNCGNPYAGAGPNCNCFRNNEISSGAPINTELDGLTQVFFASGTIHAGTNHIKIAIADCGDRVLDSDVMIRCQSFTCSAAPPTGACCLTNGECVTLAQADCAANGGIYHGDLSSCIPNPCGTAFGACCLPSLACEVEDPSLCSANGGIYQGDGTPCVPSPCGAAVGACCFGNAVCQTSDPFNCVGVYMGDGSACSPNPCTNLTGACCADAAICDIQIPANCGDVFIGVGTTCSPNPCDAIVGACCHGSGLCQITLHIDCGDIYMGDRTICDPNPCVNPASVPGIVARGFHLGQPRPLPATGQVTVEWSLPAAGVASLTVWDAEGRLRATLFTGRMSAGPAGRSFALADGAGHPIPSGVYWLRLVAGTQAAVQKIVISN